MSLKEIITRDIKEKGLWKQFKDLKKKLLLKDRNSFMGFQRLKSLDDFFNSGDECYTGDVLHLLRAFYEELKGKSYDGPDVLEFGRLSNHILENLKGGDILGVKVNFSKDDNMTCNFFFVDWLSGAPSNKVFAKSRENGFITPIHYERIVMVNGKNVDIENEWYIKRL